MYYNVMWEGPQASLNIQQHRHVLVRRFYWLSNRQKLQNTICGGQLFEWFIFLDHGEILKIEKVVTFWRYKFGDFWCNVMTCVDLYWFPFVFMIEINANQWNPPKSSKMFSFKTSQLFQFSIFSHDLKK